MGKPFENYAPGDVLLEIRVTPEMLIAWDPNAERQVEVAYLDESNDPEEALRAALRTLAGKVANNQNYIEGGGDY